MILSRESSTRQVAVNAFLVDTYCLGVKNIIGNIITRTRYDKTLAVHSAPTCRRAHVPLAEALRFLEAAVAYARNLGLEPHPDYEKAILLFGDADAAASEARFTFGKDGKPFFFAGPNDGPARCEMIMSILNKTVGQNNYHFTIPIAEGASIHGMPDSLDGYEIIDEDVFKKSVAEDEEDDEMPRKSR